MRIIIDGYRPHMSLATLKPFHNVKVMDYALRAHTSRKLQHLELTVFSVFKAKLNEASDDSLGGNEGSDLDSYSFCKLLSASYADSLCQAQMKAASEKQEYGHGIRTVF